MTLGDFTPFHQGTEESRYSGPYVQDGSACYIHIIREPSGDWQLSVATQANELLETGARFPSEVEAKDHFLRLVHAVGMEAISEGQLDLVSVSEQIRQTQG